MHLKRDLNYTVSLSVADIVRLLKADHPTSLVVQALPLGGKDVTLSAGSGGVSLKFSVSGEAI